MLCRALMSQDEGRTSGLVLPTTHHSPNNLILEACQKTGKGKQVSKNLLSHLDHKLQLPNPVPLSEEAVKNHLGTAHCQWLDLKH